MWYIYAVNKDKSKGNLNSLRKEIQTAQLILIVLVTIFLSAGGLFINLKSNNKIVNENLQNTSELITRLYSFTKDFSQKELCAYMDEVVKDISDVDLVSIIDKDGKRIYHTHHHLINTQYNGTVPDFNLHKNGYYTENNIGPSGPQRRTYSAIFDENGNYSGFIMTIRLQTSIRSVTIRTILLFLFVTLTAVLIELAFLTTLFKKLKKQFLDFTEDFEGTKFLVDSMRANNHDFTNKLHVILGLIQIGQYEQAEAYIENISIIQRETVSSVMKAIDNSSFAALLIGKIARASECNVRFILMENTSFNSSHIDIPSEALVTITGNLIDNAIDSMNISTNEIKELKFGAFTKPGEMLIIIEDTGSGIDDKIKNQIFENGFSTKGKGRGVGLFHTKQLIESLGGNITFESQKNKGTCFTVSLKNK